MASSIDDRSYHDTSSGYCLPNDSVEHIRLDEQSRALTTMMGGQPFITDLQRLGQDQRSFKALDVGCGTGIMTTLLARNIEQSALDGSRSDVKIFGVDFSPVPSIHPRPASVEYLQANVMDLFGVDPRFQSGTFDFITHRMLVLGIPDWPRYIRTCFSLLKPGGRIELQDVAMRWYDSHGVDMSQGWKWINILRKASSKLGINTLGPETFKALMLEAGFKDVEERVYKWHCTDQHWDEYPDSDEIGRYTVNTMNKIFPRGLSKMVQNAGQDKAEDLQGLDGLKGLEEDYARTVTGLPTGSHLKFFVVCGRKP